eukprot:m.17581 g.17581  ORF g.17581 m.17581 type:complete len:295 (+) comp5202_c0_seq1:1-885(+)
MDCSQISCSELYSTQPLRRGRGGCPAHAVANHTRRCLDAMAAWSGPTLTPPGFNRRLRSQTNFAMIVAAIGLLCCEPGVGLVAGLCGSRIMSRGKAASMKNFKMNLDITYIILVSAAGWLLLLIDHQFGLARYWPLSLLALIVNLASSAMGANLLLSLVDQALSCQPLQKPDDIAEVWTEAKFAVLVAGMGLIGQCPGVAVVAAFCGWSHVQRGIHDTSPERVSIERTTLKVLAFSAMCWTLLYIENLLAPAEEGATGLPWWIHWVYRGVAVLFGGSAVEFSFRPHLDNLKKKK